jgi:hypothetical protein
MAITTGSGALASDTEVALKTKLRVEPPGQPTFEIEQKFRYSQFGVPQVGMRIGVVFDPDDHETIELDRFAGGQAQGSPPMGFPAAGPAGLDLGSLLSTVQEAKAQSHGDPQALAAALQAKFGGQAPIVMTGGNASQPPAAEEDPIDQLTKLADLRDRGVVTPEEFAAQKARILGEEPGP